MADQEIPKYRGIVNGAQALQILGVFAALGAIGGGVMWIADTSSAAFSFGVVSLAACPIFFLLASVSYAIRDIARNSFKE